VDDVENRLQPNLFTKIDVLPNVYRNQN
jgi:hypothetical protein